MCKMGRRKRDSPQISWGKNAYIVVIFFVILSKIVQIWFKITEESRKSGKSAKLRFVAQKFAKGSKVNSWGTPFGLPFGSPNP